MVKRAALDPEKDLVDAKDVKVSLKWMKANEGRFAYSHSRHLPATTAQKAIDYIAAIVAKYPAQIRYSMAKPLWERFAQEWCDTGDEEKSLRVI